MAKKIVGIIGASSLVGRSLTRRLCESGYEVVAVTRRESTHDLPGVSWYRIGNLPTNLDIREWICVAPIWVLPDCFRIFMNSGARRIIALSSTSRFTKSSSSDVFEQATAVRLAEAEKRFSTWSVLKGIDWCILRPTLIYGLGQDRNVSELIYMIRRYRFFPLLGQAMGLRQPVHSEDVAVACISAMEHVGRLGRCYNLSGGETLPYREMVGRIFHAIGMRPKFISIPLPMFYLAIRLLRLFPRYRNWRGTMAERMNQDLVFDHADAVRDLGFRPRPFFLGVEDIPEG